MVTCRHHFQQNNQVMIAFFQLSDGFFPYTGFALVVLLEAFVSMAKKLSDLGFVFRSVELFFKLFVQLDWIFDRIRAFREIRSASGTPSNWACSLAC